MPPSVRPMIEAEDEGYFFENVRDIFAADDMTIVNLEGPLTTSEQMREGQTYCIKGIRPTHIC